MATKFDMSWDEVKSGSNSQVNYMRLESGSAGNLVRIVSNPSEVDVHWEVDKNGARHKFVCGGSKCILCEHGSNVQTRYQMLIIDKSNWNREHGYNADGPQVKVLDVGRSVVKAIKNYASDPDYGNPMMYDIKIKKEGTGKDTRYSVVPSPKKTELTDIEKKAVEEAPTIKDINKIRTTDEILNMNLLLLQDIAGDDDEEAPSSSNSGSEDSDWDNF